VQIRFGCGLDSRIYGITQEFNAANIRTHYLTKVWSTYILTLSRSVSLSLNLSLVSRTS